MNAPANAVARLRKLDACAVSDALDKLGLPSTVTHLPQRSGSRRIAGRAITVKLVAAADAPPATGTAPHLGATAVMLAGSDDIIVVEQRTGLDAGSWGGILSLAAVQRGVAGVVADGPVRDIDEARDYDLPVFCRGLTARTARARVVEAGTNVPVVVDGVAVAPGDFVIADNSAVVFVSATDIDRVLDAAEQIAAREAVMAKALLADQPVTEVMGANYEHMLRDTAA